MLLRGPVEIANVIRPMRGHSQSFLVRGSDGDHYICKLGDNPQGNRSLINECIAGHLLTALGVATPSLATLSLNDSYDGRGNLFSSLEPHWPISAGPHLGSKCPVDIDTVAILDFLPSTLYSQVANLGDVGVVFAFDQWVAHIAHNRQFIFARQPSSLKPSAAKRTSGNPFAVWPIDNGMCFGHNWSFIPQALYAYHPFHVYTYFTLEESIYRGVQRIQSLPASAFEPATYENIPRCWFNPGDKEELTVMLGELQKRRLELVASTRDKVGSLRPGREACGTAKRGKSCWMPFPPPESINSPTLLIP